MITIQLTSSSKVGCVRSQNEDMILVGNHFVRNDSFNTRVDATFQNTAWKFLAPVGWLIE